MRRSWHDGDKQVKCPGAKQVEAWRSRGVTPKTGILTKHSLEILQPSPKIFFLGTPLFRGTFPLLSSTSMPNTPEMTSEWKLWRPAPFPLVSNGCQWEKSNRCWVEMETSVWILLRGTIGALITPVSILISHPNCLPYRPDKYCGT